jgi:hypothetical protein
MHIETGLWCVSALVDVAPHPGFMAAAGTGLFGILPGASTTRTASAKRRRFTENPHPVGIIALRFQVTTMTHQSPLAAFLYISDKSLRRRCG